MPTNLRKAIGSAICAIRGRHHPVFAEKWTLTPAGKEHMTWRGWMCSLCRKPLPTTPDNNHLN